MRPWIALLLCSLCACSRGGEGDLALVQAAPPSGSQAAPAAQPAPVAPTIDPARLQMFGVLPPVFESQSNPITNPKVELGRTLFYDPRFSISQQISCNTCHDLATYGVDHEKVSTGHKNQKGARNSPTVYNAAGKIAQFWDGRAASVEEQAKGPILNPIEMGMPNEKVVLRVLRSIPEYQQRFRAVFPEDDDPITFDNMARAIGAFERTLVTPSRWDRFQSGEANALNEAEKQGFNTFVDVGCAACHAGPLVGGAAFQRLGLVKPWPNQDDLGRFKVTGRPEDKLIFVVPTLRNVTKTAPYFHDGSVATLEEAIRLMGRYQLGRELDDGQVRSIATWLGSLTGEIPQAKIAKPPLPKAGPNTPKPGR